MLSDMVEILTLQSPYKLLKSLGALSKYAKCSQSLTKIINILILFLSLGYNGMVKKTISRYSPFYIGDVTSVFCFREGDKVTEATYGREYQLQAKMDNPSGNV